MLNPSYRQQYTRVPGPFEGAWVGFLNTPVRIYDLSEGGCFVNALQKLRRVGRPLVLKIDVPDAGWITLTAQVMHGTPQSGFAVSFVDVPADVADRLGRGLVWLRGLLDESETDRVMRLPACPRCHGTSVKPLGMAGSKLPWFTCAACDAVWAARELGVIDQTVASTEGPVSGTQHPSTKQILIADDDGRC